MNKPREIPHVLLSEFESAITPTDRFHQGDVTPILLGLFGEVGNVMSTSKKFHREKDAFSTGYMRDEEEELGDTLWYVSTLCRRLNLRLTDLYPDALDGVGYSTSRERVSYGAFFSYRKFLPV